MRRLLSIRRRWPVFALVALYAYLTLHTLSGDQGVMKWADYEDEAVALAADLDALRTERASLEVDASALSSSALDLDRLDTTSRRVLFVARGGELVIPISD